MANQRTTGCNTAKERHWRSVIERWTRSGETITGFFRERQLSRAVFNWWRRELARRDGRPLRLLRNRRSTRPSPKTRRRLNVTAKGTCFVPVRLRGALPGPSSGQTIEIELVGGRLVRVAPSVSAEALMRVVTALEAGQC